MMTAKMHQSKWEEQGGGRRTGRRQAGVQNQKQEPHTKMWGTIASPLVQSIKSYDLQFMFGDHVAPPSFNSQICCAAFFFFSR